MNKTHIDALTEEDAVQLRQELIDFFVWFRSNGEKYIGFSIEKFIDLYLKQQSNGK